MNFSPSRDRATRAFFCHPCWAFKCQNKFWLPGTRNRWSTIPRLTCPRGLHRLYQDQGAPCTPYALARCGHLSLRPIERWIRPATRSDPLHHTFLPSKLKRRLCPRDPSMCHGVLPHFTLPFKRSFRSGCICRGLWYPGQLPPVGMGDNFTPGTGPRPWALYLPWPERHTVYFFHEFLVVVVLEVVVRVVTKRVVDTDGRGGASVRGAASTRVFV